MKWIGSFEEIPPVPRCVVTQAFVDKLIICKKGNTCLQYEGHGRGQ
jgi:hypothetical protein